MKDSTVIKLHKSSVEEALTLMAKEDVEEIVMCGIKGNTLYLGTSKLLNDTKVMGALESMKLFVWGGA